MFRPFAQPVECCGVLLGVVAQFETGQTLNYVQTDVTTPNIVGSCWSTMLRPFVRGFMHLSM